MLSTIYFNASLRYMNWIENGNPSWNHVNFEHFANDVFECKLKHLECTQNTCVYSPFSISCRMWRISIKETLGLLFQHKFSREMDSNHCSIRLLLLQTLYTNLHCSMAFHISNTSQKHIHTSICIRWWLMHKSKIRRIRKFQICWSKIGHRVRSRLK